MPRRSQPVIDSRFRARRIALVVFVILVIVVGLFFAGKFFLLDDRFLLEDVALSGADSTSDEEILAVVTTAIEGKKLGFIPRNNVLLLPKSKISASLLRQFPRLSEVSLEVPEAKQLEVKVSEHVPAYLWCDVLDEVKQTTEADDVAELPESEEENDSENDNDKEQATSTKEVSSLVPINPEIVSLAGDETLSSCYVMDDAGLIFAAAPKFTGTIYDTYYGQIVEPTELIWERPIGYRYSPLGNQDLFSMMIFLQEEMLELDLRFVQVEVTDAADVVMTSDVGWRLMFSSTQTKEELMKNLRAISTSGVFGEGVSISDVEAKLDYLDLRFGTKVYYRMIDGSTNEN